MQTLCNQPFSALTSLHHGGLCPSTADQNKPFIAKTIFVSVCHSDGKDNTSASPQHELVP